MPEPEFKQGDKVRLTQRYLQSKSEKFKRDFSGDLTVIANQGGILNLSNGKDTVVCNIGYVRKN
jgi:hypothetical protein